MATYSELLQRLRQNVKNSNTFKSTLWEFHEKLHAEPDLTRPGPKAAYDDFVKIYGEGKYKGLKCLNFFFYTLADAHYQYVQHAKLDDYSKAREMYSKSIQAGWKFSDEEQDIYFSCQLGMFYSNTLSSADNPEENRNQYLRDMDKMVKSCNFAKGASACICHYYRGIALWFMLRTDEALTSFRTSLKLLTNSSLAQPNQYLGKHQIFCKIGMCHFDMQNYNLAISFFDKVIDTYDPTERKSFGAALRSMYQRSLALRLVGKKEEAYSGLDAFLNLMNSQNVPAVFQFDKELITFVDKSRAILSDLQMELNRPLFVKKKSTNMNLKKDTKLSDANKFFQKGKTYFGQDRQKEALEAFKNCYKIKLEVFRGRIPLMEYKEIHTALGDCSHMLKMYEEAIKHYTAVEDCLRKTIDLNVVADKVFLCGTTEGLADCYDKLNYDQESLHFWKKAKDLLPDSYNEAGRANYNIARLLSRMGDHETALEYYRDGLKMEKTYQIKDPKEIFAHQNLVNMGRCYRSLGQYKEALDCVEKSLAFMRSHSDLKKYATNEIKEEKGLILLGLNRHKEGLKCMIEADVEWEKIMKKSFLQDLAGRPDLPFDLGDAEMDLPIKLALMQSPASCRNALFQFLCKKRIYAVSHPDFMKLFVRFCRDEDALENLSNTFYINGFANQELTREFLQFFLVGVNSGLSLPFLQQNRKGIKRFHNSALISDFFRHVPKKIYYGNKR